MLPWLPFQWYPEVAHYSPGVPVVLVGTKLDSREDRDIVQAMKRQNKLPVSYSQGKIVSSTLTEFSYRLWKERF